MPAKRPVSRLFLRHPHGVKDYVKLTLVTVTADQSTRSGATGRMWSCDKLARRSSMITAATAGSGSVHSPQ
jgi:hypothetical protein